jgi:hypothetical protein
LRRMGRLVHIHMSPDMKNKLLKKC